MHWPCQWHPARRLLILGRSWPPKLDLSRFIDPNLVDSLMKLLVPPLPAKEPIAMTGCPALLLLTLLCAADPSPTGPAVLWHGPLYLHNGGHWRQRVPVDVSNRGDRAIEGLPAALLIGNGPGQAPIAGTRAEAVRVCNAEGIEMLYRMTGPDGADISEGPIPSGSTLLIPVECPPASTRRYYIYFDNPLAWAVPDFLDASVGIRNGGLEAGVNDVPLGWQHDANDEQHQTFWVEETPRSGRRCLKTVVAPNAEVTWIATRQRGVHIVGGARYRLTGWVKAQEVKGFAGWYIHVGDQAKPMMISPMLNAGDGTFDWRKVSTEFTAPADADRADLGTVLRGTGTAWFDDVHLECLTEQPLSARPLARERLDLREIVTDGSWYDDKPNDDRHWDYRIPVLVRQLSKSAERHCLAEVDLTRVSARLRGKLNRTAIRVTDGAALVQHYLLDDWLLFETSVPPQSERTYFVYLSDNSQMDVQAGADYEGLLNSHRNLVSNPSFEQGDKLPADWQGAEGSKPAGTVMQLAAGARFGKRCAQLHIPASTKPAWTGWRQDVPVEPGKQYLLAGWLKTKDIANGSAQLHAHYRNASGGLCATAQMTGAGPALSGTQDWTLLTGHFHMPADIAFFQLHLTMLATGTLWHDGVLLTETLPTVPGRIECRPGASPQKLAVWPVNALVKVFPDDVAPRKPEPAVISVAHNEREPLQLALRSSKAMSEVVVEIDAPAAQSGQKLTETAVTVAGYVPIDWPTNYYRSNAPDWYRKVPTASGRCDGWAGFWPDPLLPTNRLSLSPDETRSLWVTVNVPETAAAGDYTGKVRLRLGNSVLREIPFTVHVWDFALPQTTSFPAVL